MVVTFHNYRQRAEMAWYGAQDVRVILKLTSGPPFTNMVLILIPAWISNCTHYDVWDKITYPFLNFNGATVEVNTLRPRQNGRHFADDILKYIFLNENVWIPIKMSLKFVHKGPINNIPALVQIMAWRRPGDKPLSEPVMVRLPTHICVTRPQWVKSFHPTLYWACHCLSMLGLKLIHVSKRGYDG